MQSGGNGQSPSLIAGGGGGVRWCEAEVWDSARVQGESEVQCRVKVQSGVRQNDQAEYTKSEFWGKNFLFFGVDTRVLNTNNK